MYGCQDNEKVYGTITFVAVVVGGDGGGGDGGGGDGGGAHPVRTYVSRGHAQRKYHTQLTSVMLQPVSCLL